MAKKVKGAVESAKNETQARIKRTEAYAEKVRLLFANCVNEILALKKSLPKLEEGVMYSFDGDSLAIQQKVEALLRRLASATTLAVKNGIAIEWDKANKSVDELLNTTFGEKALTDPRFRAWRNRNGNAMEAFQNRADGEGLGLSKRIWQSTQQLKEEMEVAMTLGIGEGESAAEMAKKVRQYLNDPQLMFKRFRYKIGEKEVIDYDSNGNETGKHTEPVYGRKWKKRIRDENGKLKWIDYDKNDYKPGQGVYKSAAKNAMRVARTETNMAYRKADQERWKQMDFVTGIHIEPSRSHPKKDICDKLQGDYPKDFQFDGWHPQCFCVMTPIMAEVDAMKQKTLALLNGDKNAVSSKPKQITKPPQAFQDWVVYHKDDIEKSHKKNTDAYFIRHNYDFINKILSPKLSIQDIADARHNARTEEEKEAIIKKWEERKKKLELKKTTAENIIKVAAKYGLDASQLEDVVNSKQYDKMQDATKSMVAEIQKKKEVIKKTAMNIGKTAMAKYEGIDVSYLADAVQNGQVLKMQEETKALVKEMQAQKQAFLKQAEDILKEANEYTEIDVSKLKNYIDFKEAFNAREEIKNIAQKIHEQKEAEKALSDLIPNVHEFHKTFTIEELKQAYDAAEKFISKHSHLSGMQLAASLDFEATWVQKNPKYKTSPVVQKIYEHKAKEIEEEVEWKDVKKKWSVYAFKMASYPSLTKGIQDAVSAKDLTTAKLEIEKLEKWDSVITSYNKFNNSYGKAYPNLVGLLPTGDYAKAKVKAEELEKWVDVIEKLKKAEDVDKPSATLKKHIASIKQNILDNSLSEAEDTAKKAESLTKKANKKADEEKLKALAATQMSDAEIEEYCKQNYTDKFTVHSQESYDKVMTQLGQTSKPVWDSLTYDEKNAFYYYSSSCAHSSKILSDVAFGNKNIYAERIDKAMKQMVYPHDIVLRSGQDYDMALYIYGKEFQQDLMSLGNSKAKCDAFNSKYGGLIGVNVAWMSTSFNEKGGFDKSFEIHLYCPKGTPMLNLDPISAFGLAQGANWDGESYRKGWSPYGETEIFLGRNLKYQFIRAELGVGLNGTNRIYVQIVGQVK